MRDGCLLVKTSACQAEDGDSIPTRCGKLFLLKNFLMFCAKFVIQHNAACMQHVQLCVRYFLPPFCKNCIRAKYFSQIFSTRGLPSILPTGLLNEYCQYAFGQRLCKLSAENIVASTCACFSGRTDVEF